MSLIEEKCMLNMMSGSERGRGCRLQRRKETLHGSETKNSVRLSLRSVPRVWKLLATWGIFNC